MTNGVLGFLAVAGGLWSRLTAGAREDNAESPGGLVCVPTNLICGLDHVASAIWRGMRMGRRRRVVRSSTLALGGWHVTTAWPAGPLASEGVVWHGVVRCGVVWCVGGVVWCSVLCCAVVCCAWCAVVCCALVCW